MHPTEANDTPSTDDLSTFPGSENRLPNIRCTYGPIPANAVVNVKLAEPQTATILLLDLVGTALIRKRIYYRAEVQLDVQSIPPGQYTVVAEYHGQTFSEKIAVNR